MKKEVKVTFETITPLWTGNAWGECKEIRPSSLIGSLRFWFEVICYFSGVCTGEDFNSELGRFEKEVNRKELEKFKEKNGSNLENILKHLANDQRIPIPSIVFGATNWRSLIEIKSITPIKDYCFGNKLNLPNKICISKNLLEIKENINCPRSSNREWSVFYLPHPYFYGKFEVIFKVEELVLDSIFYPLLNFIDKYGFWGGKWNIGYGRLKIIDRLDGTEEFDLSLFGIDKKINFEEVVLLVNNKDKLIDKSKSKEKKILILYEIAENNNFKELIKTLLKEKIEIKIKISDSKLRHELFGKTGKIEGEDLPQGSKIFPYIYEEESLKGGFLSIAGILKLYEESKNKEINGE